VEQILDEVYFLDSGSVILSGNTEDIRNEKKMSLDEVYKEVLYVD